MGNQPGVSGGPAYFDHAMLPVSYGDFVVGSETLSLRSVRGLMQQFQKPQGSVMHPKEVDKLLGLLRNALINLGPGIELDIPAGTTLTVVGDIHGQLFDLLKIFATNGEPSASNRYLFDGDFVDRGKHGAEVVLILAAWKVLYPDYVHLLRGNHEVSTINEYYGFDEELRIKYPKESGMRLKFNNCFALLPVWCIIQERIFVVHGGLPKDAPRTTIPALRHLQKVLEPAQESLFQDLLWSDPQEPEGMIVSERGAGVTWGPDITEDFLQRNSLEMIIRAHQLCQDGYRMQHNGKVLTVFSAPNYCGRLGNFATIAKIDPKLAIAVHTFSAADAAACMQRSQQSVRQVALTHSVGSVLHHKPQLPHYVSDHPEQAVEVQPCVAGHQFSAGASGLAFSPILADGKVLLVSVSSTDNTLQLWDATLDADLRHVHLLSLPLQKPFKVAWSINDAVTVGFMDGKIMMFTSALLVETGKQMAEVHREQQLMETEFANSFFPMQAEYDNAVLERKAQLNAAFEGLQQTRIESQHSLKAKQLQIAKACVDAAAVVEVHGDSVTSMEWTADGEFLASCSKDRTITVSSSTQTESLQLVLTNQTGRVLADVAWRAEHRILALACHDGSVMVMDVTAAIAVPETEPIILADWKLPSSRPGLAPRVNAVAFNSTGTMLAAGGGDETLMLYDENFQLIHRLAGGHGLAVAHLSFSPDGRYLASAGLDNTVRLWSPQDALDLPMILQSIERQWRIVQHESTTEERQSWQKQMQEMELSVQKAMMLGLSDRPHGLCWKPAADGSYSLAAAADGDVAIGVWEVPKIKQ